MKTYEELRKINVNEHIEKKNNLSYLSWAWAVDTLFQHDPEASWGYHVFDGKPWMDVNGTFMVFCTVKAFGRERTAQLPIMDYRNKPITAFTSFDLNTTMQRCLAKAISLHGIGLYIYAGEDLPDGEGSPVDRPKAFETPHKPTDGAWESQSEEEQVYLTGIAMDVIADLSAGDVAKAAARLEAEKLDNDEKVALWTRFDSKQRAALKKHNEAQKVAA